VFGLVPGRVTYVVDKNGVIQMVFDSILAAKHMLKAMETIKKFFL
jgi:peroxiredoxin Q/BCP